MGLRSIAVDIKSCFFCVARINVLLNILPPLAVANLAAIGVGPALMARF
jgi:hypothetical protein